MPSAHNTTKLHTFPGNFPIDREVANLLVTSRCNEIWETTLRNRHEEFCPCQLVTDLCHKIILGHLNFYPMTYLRINLSTLSVNRAPDTLPGSQPTMPKHTEGRCNYLQYTEQNYNSTMCLHNDINYFSGILYISPETDLLG